MAAMMEDIELLWARLETWLDGCVPHIVSGLAPPADGPTLAATEERLGLALPVPIRHLLAIHNGGPEVIGGWDLLSADGIVKEYQSIQEHARDPERAAAWIPFLGFLSGNYMCVELTPGNGGTAGQVFHYFHDDEPAAPIAPSLTVWLERIVTCVESGAIRYDVDREEFLPFYGSTGFAIAFDPDSTLRFDAEHPDADVRGPRSVGIQAFESAGVLPAGVRVELVENGNLLHVWDLDELRETAEITTDFNVFLEEPAPLVRSAGLARLRLSGLRSEDTVWVHLAR